MRACALTCVTLPKTNQIISALWISMEYLEGGSLQDLIKSSTNNLDEHTAQWILREILKVRGLRGIRTERVYY